MRIIICTLHKIHVSWHLSEINMTHAIATATPVVQIDFGFGFGFGFGLVTSDVVSYEKLFDFVVKIAKSLNSFFLSFIFLFFVLFSSRTTTAASIRSKFSIAFDSKENGFISKSAKKLSFFLVLQERVREKEKKRRMQKSY